MAQNITYLGANYASVPQVILPKTGGGTAAFVDTTDATAGSSQILSGYSAYTNGALVSGNVIVQHYYTGSSAPDSSLGVNGDIYLQTGG